MEKDNKNDYSELTQFIGDKFEEVDKKFGIVTEKLDSLEGRMDNLETMFRDLQTAVDAYAKRADAYFQEMVMLSHKVDRHEKWLRQIADKVGVKLEE